MGFLERFGLRGEKQEKGKEIQQREAPGDPRAKEIIEKLKNFRDDLEDMNEQSADDYVKNMMALEAMPLAPAQAKEISLIHQETMERLRVAGKLKDFTQSIDARGRIRALGQAVGKIAEKQKS